MHAFCTGDPKIEDGPDPTSPMFAKNVLAKKTNKTSCNCKIAILREI